MASYPMKEKFQGPNGRRLLIAAIKEQRIVAHNDAIAARIAASGSLVEFNAGNAIITQGELTDDLYLLLVGTVEVQVNGRIIARRTASESIGEMGLLSPTVQRSATVIAETDTVAVKISEIQFQEIADQFPVIWKPIANVVAERLRQRQQFHRQPNPNPVLFLGSSVEGLSVADELVRGLKFDKILVRKWSTPGVFEPGGINLETIVKEVDSCDFAAFVFGPDDQIASRNEKYAVPRDNVIFELGLAMGRLNRDRSFIIKEHLVDVKIPTDLLGITPITYVRKGQETLSQAIDPVCTDLRQIINKLGPR